MNEATTDCRPAQHSPRPAGTIRCSICNCELKTLRERIQSEKRTLCEDCYRAMVYPNRGSGME